MPSILLYCNRYYNFTGGLEILMMLMDYLKKYNKKCYLCPILKNISSLDIITQLNDININNLTQSDLNGFFNNTNVPGLCSDSSKINKIDTSLIVPIDILKTKNNIIVYFENVIGNPTMQKYVVRHLYFFPIPQEIKTYDFNKEYICFFSHFIFNLYKHICRVLFIPDLLTTNIKEPKYLKIIKFDRHLFENIFNNNNINNNNDSCFMIRKFFPPQSFRQVTSAINKKCIYEIKAKIYNNIKKEFNKGKINNKKINELYNNFIKQPTRSDCIEHIINKCNSLGFTEIQSVDSTQKYINIFKNKKNFISFDPFSFTSIIACLSGCISVVKPIDGIDFDTYINSDPLVKYGIAYGYDTISHANNTKHLVLDHITSIYNENETNVFNFILDIETYFNIKIDNIITK